MAITEDYSTGCITWCSWADTATWIDPYNGCTPLEKPEKSNKNPFTLLSKPVLRISEGRPMKKKESFKKASHIVITRVGIIE